MARTGHQSRRSSKVGAGTHVLGEHVGYEPCHGLTLDLGLEVDSLDAEEDLAKRLRSHHVELPLGGKAGAVGDDGRGDGGGRGEGGEEDDEREGVVEISERVSEGGVPEGNDCERTIPRATT